MIDTLKRSLRSSDASDVLQRLGVGLPFALLTLHRPSNVDDPAALRRIFSALEEIARQVPIVFPVHPRTVKMLAAFGVRLAGTEGKVGFRLLGPLGYLDFLHLQKRAALVLTDSGGIQEETTILGVPCLTLRETTERPVTLTHGTNQLVGSDPARILAAARRILESGCRRPRTIPLWDGAAAARIVSVFVRLQNSPPEQAPRPQRARAAAPRRASKRSR
jgi:UDP-N-acetylglucosamine 2-epimerase (non-hydrolysing)